MAELWLHLLASLAMLSVLMLVWEMLSDVIPLAAQRRRATVFGILMAVGAALSMMTAVQVLPGFYADLRTPLVAASGFFGGPVAAAISTMVALGVRIYLSGDGLIVGIINIALSAMIGLIGQRLLAARRMRYTHVGLFASATTASVMVAYLLFPAGMRVEMLRQTGLPIALLVFLGALFVGSVLLKERRRREVAEVNTMYRSMVETLPDSLNMKDTSGRFVIANHATAALMGARSAEDLVGRTDADFYPADIAATYREDEVAVIASGTYRLIDQPKLGGGDGAGSGWLSTLKAPIRDDEGVVRGLITHNRDVTEERRNAALKHEFVATVSHELRTPLTSIRGSLGLIAAGVAGDLPPKAASLIRIAHANSERLVRLINDILDIEKIESGKMAFETHPVLLESLVAQALDAAADYMPERHVTLRLTHAAPKAAASIDSDRMIQVLLNLLSNAIKFSPPEGIVGVGIDADAGHVRMTVSDEGAGIPESFRDRVFNRFEQADASDTRAIGGTGLGLSIAKAIVERHGGEIDFTSESGRGTTFTVTLPRVPAPATASITAPADAPRRPARILVCESDATVSALIVRNLRAEGLEVDVAADIADIAPMLERGHYAAMTLDADMTGASVSSVLRNLRSASGEADMPVIVVSSHVDAARARLGAAAIGIADFCEKPVLEARLGQAVLRAMAQRPERKPRVLCVEDDADLCAVVAAAFGDRAETTAAGSLLEARRAMAQERFDVIILDLALPDGSGLDLLDAANDSPPVVVFSAVDLDESQAHRVRAALTKARATELDLAKLVLGLVSEPAPAHAGAQTAAQ